MAQRNRARLTAHEGRRFAFTVGSAFLALGALAWWRGRASVAAVLVGLGALLAALATLIPGRLSPLHRAWMRLAAALSTITNPIFMGIIFFAIITPMGMLLRLFGKAPLAHDPHASSRWHARAKGAKRSNMSRQF
ncbi:MAG: hypothetical protein ABI910_07080 [Gemmatimonadota bacterium]